MRNWFPALARPIDAGVTPRGRRVLGDHETWRGLLAGVLAFEVQVLLYEAGMLHGLAMIDYASIDPLPGVLLGLGAGVGDVAKSFFKRQIGIVPGASWLGPDQLDFMVGAYAFVGLVHVPLLLPTLVGLPIVFVGDVVVSACTFGMGLKEAWI